MYLLRALPKQGNFLPERKTAKFEGGRGGGGVNNCVPVLAGMVLICYLAPGTLLWFGFRISS